MFSYRILNYPPLPKWTEIDNEMARAFKMWSDVADLSFYHDKNIHHHSVDVTISFQVGYHGDVAIFDGQTLAHAFHPPRSEIHFDRNQNWTIRSYQGVILFIIINPK